MVCFAVAAGFARRGVITLQYTLDNTEVAVDLVKV